MTLLPDRQRRGKGKNRVDAKPRTHAALVDASVNGQKSKEETQVAIRHTHLLRAVRPWFGLPARLACPRFLTLDNAWLFPADTADNRPLQFVHVPAIASWRHQGPIVFCSGVRRR
jgi:hypothetical protein